MILEEVDAADEVGVAASRRACLGNRRTESASGINRLVRVAGFFQKKVPSGKSAEHHDDDRRKDKLEYMCRCFHIY